MISQKKNKLEKTGTIMNKKTKTILNKLKKTINLS